MADEFIRLESIKAHVNQVVFMPHISDPPHRPFGFVYFISIENQSAFSVQVIARKWIVKEADGKTLVVDGEGVVGEKPHITSNDSFSYNSCHVVGSNSTAKGAFYGVLEDGRKVIIDIPEFELNIPN